jgi:hypothetical protein
MLLDADSATASAAFGRAIELTDSGSTYAGRVARVSAITLRSRQRI